ncbi:hypothetical protein L6452_26498 [Arctium lappa]|uniref:Uncharacterized protein n=1 Tax=Arctium lappa TaxID=4217 RepID=A0ACB8ZUC4_ARCLA|nr:hypothetical protein L6452_26498 [Arctium lappa]
MVVCHCGLFATIRTSWTTKNPGRRFYGCPRKVSRCDFFSWYDQQLCNRSVEVIPGLLRSKNIVEASLKAKEKEIMSLPIPIRQLTPVPNPLMFDRTLFCQTFTCSAFIPSVSSSSFGTYLKLPNSFFGNFPRTDCFFI